MYGGFHKLGEAQPGPRGTECGGRSGKSVLMFRIGSPGVLSSLITASLKYRLMINPVRGDG